jgi:hypothetical protein
MVNFVFDSELSPLLKKPLLKGPPAGLRTLEPGAQILVINTVQAHMNVLV